MAHSSLVHPSVPPPQILTESGCFFRLSSYRGTGVSLSSTEPAPGIIGCSLNLLSSPNAQAMVVPLAANKTLLVRYSLVLCVKTLSGT